MENKTKQNVFIKLLEKVNIKVCVVLFVALSMIPILYLSFFAFPYADDFGNSIGVREVLLSENSTFFNVLKACADKVVATYHSWQGTYSSVFLMTLQPGVFGEQYYFLTIWFMMGITLFGFLFSGKNLMTAIDVNGRTGCFIGLLVWFYFIQTMPTPREGLFWFNGAVHYMPFSAMVLIVNSMLIKGYVKGFTKTQIILISVMGFILSGGNQLTSFLSILITIMLIGYILFFGKSKKNIKSILIPFVSSLIGFVIMAIAPGNVVRYHAGIESPSVLKTIFVAAYSYFEAVLDVWFGFTFVLFLALLTPLFIEITKKVNNFSYKGLIMLFVAQYACICAMLCTIYITGGGFGDDRVKNAIYCMFLVAMVVLYYYAIGLLIQKKVFNFENLPKLNKFQKKLIGGSATLFILVCIIFLGSKYFLYSTTGTALIEIMNGVHTTYAKQIEERLELLYDDNVQNVVFEPQVRSVFFGSEMLYSGELSYVNSGMINYYNKEFITSTYTE